MSQPSRVSVVLPTFRRPAFLARAIASVQLQTLTDWELLVIDDNDADTDDRLATERTMERYAGEPRIRYVRHARNSGGAAARNTGICSARAPWIAFLDDDDEWHPGKLARQLAALRASEDTVALVYCRVLQRHTATGAERPWRTDGRSHTARDLLIRNNIGTTSCVMCRADALREVGMFDETLRSRQDVDLYIRLADRYPFAFVDATLVTMNLHGHGRITTDVDATVDAHQRFYQKYRERIDGDPEVKAARLEAVGLVLLDGGRRLEARAYLQSAWRLHPTNRYVLQRLLLTYEPLSSLARLVRRWRSRRSTSEDAANG